jgi:hypothetical protein
MARTDSAITFRLPAELASLLDDTVAELAARVEGTPGARVTRNAVGIEALRAGLDALRRKAGITPPGPPPEDPRQTRIPGA